MSEGESSQQGLLAKVKPQFFELLRRVESNDQPFGPRLALVLETKWLAGSLMDHRMSSTSEEALATLIQEVCNLEDAVASSGRKGKGKDTTLDLAAVLLETMNALGMHVSRCSACFDPFDPSTLKTAPCGEHSYCDGCMREGLSQTLGERPGFAWRCCGHEIPWRPYREILSIGLIHALIELELRREKSSKVHCHDPRYSAWIDASTISDDGIATCSKCAKTTCVGCSSAEHSGQDCPTPEENEQMFRSLAMRMGWKECPSCKAMVENNLSLNIGTCPYCQTGFCMRCASTISSCLCSRSNRRRLEIRLRREKAQDAFRGRRTTASQSTAQTGVAPSRSRLEHHGGTSTRRHRLKIPIRLRNDNGSNRARPEQQPGATSPSYQIPLVPMDHLEITESSSRDLSQRNQSVDSVPVAPTQQPGQPDNITLEGEAAAVLPDEDGIYSWSGDDDMELSDDLNDAMKSQCRLTEGNFLTGTDCLGGPHEWTDGRERPARCRCGSRRTYDCSRCFVLVCAGCLDLLISAGLHQD